MNTSHTENKLCTSKFEDALDFDFYKILLDPVRSQIMVFLGTYGDSNISTVAKNFPQDRTVISRHLSLMERYGIVTRTKVSREFIYHLNADFVVKKFETTSKNLKELAES